MKHFGAITLILILLLNAQPINAFSISDSFYGSGYQHTTLGTIYNPIIRLVYILGGVLVLISFIYAGLKMIRGTPQDLESGRLIIFGSFTGFIVLISVYWISLITGTIIGTEPTSGTTRLANIGTTPTPTVISQIIASQTQNLCQFICGLNGGYLCQQSDGYYECATNTFDRNFTNKCQPCEIYNPNPIVVSGSVSTPFNSICDDISNDNKLKVGSWNIGTFSHLNGETRDIRMQRLGNIIKNNCLEAIYLQEFNGLQTHNDLVALTDQLATLNWSMNSISTSYKNFDPNKPENELQHLTILSRYPLDQSTLQIKRPININSSARVAQSIISRQTPIGDIRLSNIHTHFDEDCPQFLNYLNFYDDFDPNITLMGGDTNIKLNLSPYDSSENNTCTPLENNRSRYIYTCTNPNQCHDNEPDANTNSGLKEYLDWFVLFNNSELEIEETIAYPKELADYTGVADSHSLLTGQISNKTIITTPTPTPTPAPSTVPTTPSTFAGNCSTYPIPATPPSPKSDNNYKMMTFNVMDTEYDQATGRSREENRNQIERIAQAIVNEQLDFVFLQEMSNTGDPDFKCQSPSTDSACCIPVQANGSPVAYTYNRFDVLMQKLISLNYPMYFQNADNNPPSSFNNASRNHEFITTLSRYPIVSIAKNPIEANARLSLQINVDIGGRIVKLYNTHLQVNTVDLLGDISPAISIPIPYDSVVIGDYNYVGTLPIPNHSLIYRQESLIDAYVYRSPTISQGLIFENLGISTYDGSIRNSPIGITFEGHTPVFAKMDISNIPNTATTPTPTPDPYYNTCRCERYTVITNNCSIFQSNPNCIGPNYCRCQEPLKKPTQPEVSAEIAECSINNPFPTSVQNQTITIQYPKQYEDKNIYLRILGEYIDLSNSSKVLDVVIDDECDVNYDLNNSVLYSGSFTGTCRNTTRPEASYVSYEFNPSIVKQLRNITSYGYIIVNTDDDYQNPDQIGFIIDTSCTP